MNIELRFLQKAIEDKNFIVFSYENQKFSHIKPLALKEEQGVFTLETNKNSYNFYKIKKLKILKERF